MNCTHCSSDQYSINVTCANCGIIYKALPHWVGLTDEEKQDLYDRWERTGDGLGLYYLFIEAKLREKNS